MGRIERRSLSQVWALKSSGGEPHRKAAPEEHWRNTGEKRSTAPRPRGILGRAERRSAGAAASRQYAAVPRSGQHLGVKPELTVRWTYARIRAATRIRDKFNASTLPLRDPSAPDAGHQVDMITTVQA